MRGPEGVAIVLDDVAQLADQRFGLEVIQVKVHARHGSVRQLIKEAPQSLFLWQGRRCQFALASP
jgi:hypothetical protein